MASTKFELSGFLDTDIILFFLWRVTMTDSKQFGLTRSLKQAVFAEIGPVLAEIFKNGHRRYVCEVTGIRRYSTFDQKKNSERIFLDKQYLKDISYGAVIYLIFRMRKENAINSHKYSNF